MVKNWVLTLQYNAMKAVVATRSHLLRSAVRGILCLTRLTALSWHVLDIGFKYFVNSFFHISCHYLLIYYVSKSTNDSVRQFRSCISQDLGTECDNKRENCILDCAVVCMLHHSAEWLISPSHLLGVS